MTVKLLVCCVDVVSVGGALRMFIDLQLCVLSY